MTYNAYIAYVICPHARGDEPDMFFNFSTVEDICPTHVGMNRPAPHPMARKFDLPHARGDEPHMVFACPFVQMDLPHARGDEPLQHHRLQAGFLHLPHARGDEPREAARWQELRLICPTHVGMNRILHYVQLLQ